MRTILARPIAVAALGALLLVPCARAAVSQYAPISLPADAGGHANAHSEWWYFTGHLRDHAGHRYGYELTTFKFSGVKGMIPLQFSDTVYRIDFAITDESRHTFRSMIAYLPVTPGRTSLPAGTLHSAMKADSGTMSIDTLPGPGLAYRLRGSMSAGSLDLTLRTTRPPLLEGQGGVEQIANGYSYYYSLTNMQSSGSLGTVAGRQRVDGVTWMDHQWGNWDWRQDKGWDWLSVQLSNGTSLALTNFTDARGASYKYASVSKPEGGQLGTPNAFMIRDGRSWNSPLTHTTFPQGWKVRVPAIGLVATVVPTLSNQEMVDRFGIASYWEGSCRLVGTLRGKPVTGTAYVELVGYGKGRPVNI